MPDSYNAPRITQSFVTPRAVGMGLSLAILLNIWVPFGTYILHTSRMSVGHLPIAAFILFLAVLFIVNPLLRLQRPDNCLTGAELTLIFSILLISSLIPGKAFVSYFLTIVSTPFYFAAPENQWETLFFPYLPEWLIVSNEGNAMGWFYEGLPQGQMIPWAPWIIPVFWWMTFFVALFFVGACTVAIFRKQWVEYERLTFPLVKVSRDLIAAVHQSGSWPPIVKDRLFQAGFVLAVSIAVWNIFGFFQWVPPLPIGTFMPALQLDPSIPPVPLRINLYMLCFAFFINLDILLSIWVFFLLGILEVGALSQIGLNVTGSAPGGSGGVNSQFFGGFVMYVLYSLWTARKHLVHVVRKALNRAEPVDDSRELLSHRTAVFGLILGTIFICAWLSQSGLSWPIIIVFLAFLFILYFGTTKIIAETGVMFLDLPVNAHEITVLTLGSGQISKRSLTALGLASAYARNWRGMGMGSLALVDRITDGFWPRKKGLFALLCLTFVLSMVSSVAYTIYTGYATTGAYNFGGGAFTNLNIAYYDTISTWMQNAMTLGQYEVWFTGAGILLFVLLLKLRHWLIWWPLAPVGFAICFASTIRDSILSIFLAWLIKSILMRIGGTASYETGQRFFIGLLIGYCVGVTLSFFVDAVWFPGQGHMVHDW